MFLPGCLAPRSSMVTLGSEEVLGRLFDYFSIRGARMLDIGFSKDRTMTVALRRRVSTPGRASQVALEILCEMDEILNELLGQFREAN